MEATKPHVAVLYGGPSEEYDISVLSGQGVVQALHEIGYTVTDVHIDKHGGCFIDGNSVELEVLQQFSVCFLALHGAYGEDGTLQAQLDALQIPYTGSGAQASATAFDKYACQQLMATVGVASPASLLITRDTQANIQSFLTETNTPDGYVIKPNSSGSSYGTKLIQDSGLVEQTVTEALTVYESVLLQERIIGTEVTAGVVERFLNTDIARLPLVEIIPPAQADFFNHEVKYDGTTQEIVPARLSPQLTEKIQTMAVKAHQLLGLRQYSRSDFIIRNGEVYYLETNTLPGLTSESLLPREIVAAGSSYTALVKHLVDDALAQVVNN